VIGGSGTIGGGVTVTAGSAERPYRAARSWEDAAGEILVELAAA
jgi:hypothetical protein